MAVGVAFLVCLVLGVLADLVAGALRKASSGRRAWWRALTDFGTDVRLLVVNRDRISVVEATGAGLGLLGATLAAAAAVGTAPGGAPFLYFALALGAVGGHAAASLSDVDAEEDRASRARLESVLVEPAFLLALAAGFLRWRATDLDAVRGAHAVLGSGFEVGPPVAAIGLILATLVLLVAGGLRLAPLRGSEAGAGGGPSVLVTLCRWSLSGATVLAAGALLAGGDGAVTAGWLLEPALLPLLVTAAIGAGLFGGVRAALTFLPPAVRPLAPWAAVVVAGISFELVLLG